MSGNVVPSGNPDQNLFWYGWIPMLTGSLLCKQTLERTQRDSVIIGQNVFRPKNLEKSLVELYKSINFTQVSNTLYSSKEKPEEELLFCYLEHRSDADEKELVLTVIATTPKGKVTKVGIFKLDQPLQMIAKTKDLELENNGLVKYRVEVSEEEKEKEKEKEKERLEKTCAVQLFTSLRDFYHEHIYVTKGDCLLQPVKAGSLGDAIIQICEQYLHKIVTYHSGLKKSLSPLAPIQDFTKLQRKASCAQGEMAYAKSFSKLCAGGINHNAFTLASESFAILKEQAAEVLQAKRSRTIETLTIVLVFLGSLPIAHQWLMEWPNLPLLKRLLFEVLAAFVSTCLFSHSWRYIRRIFQRPNDGSGESE